MVTKTNKDMKFLLSESAGAERKAAETGGNPFEAFEAFLRPRGLEGNTIRIPTIPAMTRDEVEEATWQEVSITESMREGQYQRLVEEIRNEIDIVVRHHQRRNEMTDEWGNVYAEIGQLGSDLDDLLQSYYRLGSILDYTIDNENPNWNFEHTHQARYMIRMNLRRGMGTERLIVAVVA